MEVYTSFLLLMLTWTAPQTFCKSLNTDGKPGNTDADGQMIADQAGDMVLMENQIPSGMRETAPVGQDIEVVNGEPLKTWDGAEDESGNISGREQVVFSYDDMTGGKEVEMSFGDSSPEERTNEKYSLKLKFLNNNGDISFKLSIRNFFFDCTDSSFNEK